MSIFRRPGAIAAESRRWTFAFPRSELNLSLSDHSKALSKSTTRPAKWLRRGRSAIAATSVVGCLALGWLWWTAPRPHPPQVVYPGITYACTRDDKPEIAGLVHVVTVDLSKPGLDLYITPLDPDAVDAGWEYRSCWLPRVVATEDLVVGINATFFEKDVPWWVVWSGHWARSLETIVADHQVNHVDPNSYLLWFDDRLSPHLETTKPPPKEALNRARWGIAGQMVLLDKGRVSKFARHDVDARTAIGFSTFPNTLYLAAFEHASEHRVGELLAEVGATEAILLDGGDSSCFVFGPKAQCASRRSVVFPRQAHVTVFGVRDSR